MKRLLTLLLFALLFTALPGFLPALHAQQTTAAPTPLAHNYQLTYTLTTTDAGKRSGVQHFAITVSAPTNHNGLKMGEKIPVVTGSYNNGSKGDSGVQTQFTYLDVGINIDATLVEASNGLQLTSKIEQSSVSPATAPIDGVNEPVIRQMVLLNTSLLVPGKPVALGSLDIPDTTRHIEVEVTAEEVR